VTTSGASVVVIGASAGGVEALRGFVSALPRDVAGCLLVVLHVPARGTSVLPSILSRAGSRPVEHAEHGDKLQPGRILVGPPDHHLLIGDGHVRLERGPRENGHRPAIDSLFRSAAWALGSDLLGILLSGTLDDGVIGLSVIKERGGSTAVQDPLEASYPSMPQTAIDARVADHVLGVRELAKLTAESCHWPPRPRVAIVRPRPSGQDDPADESESARRATPREGTGEDEAMEPLKPGQPEGELSAPSCPNCGGALWQTDRHHKLGFACRTGHAYSEASLLEVQAEALDDAMWGAYRSLLEHADLGLRIARRMTSSGNVIGAARYEAEADEARRRAAVLREALVPSARHLMEGDADQ
jgi:two-component system chemotaxis response regulator CheB